MNTLPKRSAAEHRLKREWRSLKMNSSDDQCVRKALKNAHYKWRGAYSRTIYGCWLRNCASSERSGSRSLGKQPKQHSQIKFDSMLNAKSVFSTCRNFALFA